MRLSAVQQFEWSSAYVNGDIGEAITADALRKECNMRVVRNVYLPYEDGLTEIDLVAISKLGIFVIENKNYSADIFGTVKGATWIAYYSYFCQQRIYNPVMQNEIHKTAVLQLLQERKVEGVRVFRPVIFNDKASLCVKDGKKDVFILSSFVKVYNSVDKSFIDDIVVESLYKLFLQFSNPSVEMKIWHATQLKGY